MQTKFLLTDDVVDSALNVSERTINVQKSVQIQVEILLNTGDVPNVRGTNARGPGFEEAPLCSCSRARVSFNERDFTG